MPWMTFGEWRSASVSGDDGSSAAPGQGMAADHVPTAAPGPETGALVSDAEAVGKARRAAWRKAARDDRPVTAYGVNARSGDRACPGSSWVVRGLGV